MTSLHITQAFGWVQVATLYWCGMVEPDCSPHREQVEGLVQVGATQLCSHSPQEQSRITIAPNINIKVIIFFMVGFLQLYNRSLYVINAMRRSFHNMIITHAGDDFNMYIQKSKRPLDACF